VTVSVLAVLWLIVVVPMVVRRSDERRHERSVTGFGSAMRALGRRDAVAMGAEVYVPGERSATVPPPIESPSARTRRPVPVAQEALMYPVDRAEMSEARAQMMRRRRRSLGTLITGTIVFLVLAIAVGGLLWLPGIAFTLSLAGYFYFLRSQAVRDRERRYNRQVRAEQRRSATDGVDVTENVAYFEELPQDVVRIDDDDLDLHSMDTIDLTGLYTEEMAEVAEQRRAS